MKKKWPFWPFWPFLTIFWPFWPFLTPFQNSDRDLDRVLMVSECPCLLTRHFWLCDQMARGQEFWKFGHFWRFFDHFWPFLTLLTFLDGGWVDCLPDYFSGLSKRYVPDQKSQNSTQATFFNFGHFWSFWPFLTFCRFRPTPCPCIKKKVWSVLIKKWLKLKNLVIFWQKCEKTCLEKGRNFFSKICQIM